MVKKELKSRRSFFLRTKALNIRVDMRSSNILHVFGQFGDFFVPICTCIFEKIIQIQNLRKYTRTHTQHT